MALDTGIEKIMVRNPFFGDVKKSPEEDVVITQKNFFKYYNKIYLVMPLKSAEGFWFDPEVSVEELKDIYKNCVVLEKKTIMAKINIFFEWMKTISVEKLGKCHTGSISFDDVETDDVLILPLFLLPFDNAISFMEMYNEKDWFEDFLIKQKLAEYLKVSKSFYEIKNALETSPLTYWCKKKHLNVTDLFIKRNFRWNIFKSNTDPSKLKTIEDMKKYKLDEDGYVSMFFKTKGNFDDKFGKVNFSLHRLPRIKKFITSQQLNEIMGDISGKNRFQLFFNLLVSPDYCHLILNNGDVWDMMENVVDRCKPLVRYCLFYSYLSLYLQENIKKGFLSKEDTSILTLTNACKIPNFPYLQSNINSHPAIAAAHLINRKVIPQENFYGIPSIRDKSDLTDNTLNDIRTFQDRLNIFLTGNSSKNYLINMNWDNLHITGSVIAACVPKRHPLLNLFKKTIPEGITNPQDYLHHRYFCEYYGDSDVDVLINISHPIKFYEKALEFKKNLESGIEVYENINVNTTMDKIRRGYFKFNHSFLEKKLIPYWIKQGKLLSLEDLLSNVTNVDYAKYYIPFYMEAREKFYEKFISKMEQEGKIDNIREKYPFFFEDIKPEDIIFNLYQKVDDRFYKVESSDIKMLEGTKPKTDEEPFYEVIESTKYKIHHPMINHTFELFAIPHEDPWSCINKFHMGPVRGYYDGTEVYITISALMSFHTNLSPDYRIMFGSKDPADICNKYRMRGYGVLLNKNELAQMITYSENVKYWKNLYHIDKKKPNTIKNYFSHKKINDDLFKTRSLNSDYYDKSTCYVPPVYDEVKMNYIESQAVLQQDLQSFCKTTNPLVNELYLNQNFLSAIGKPLPLKRWMIDSSWDLFEMERLYDE